MTKQPRFPGASEILRTSAELLPCIPGKRRVNLTGSAPHGLSQRSGGSLRLPDQDVSLVRQLAALFDEPAGGVACGRRSLTYLRWKPRAGVEVRVGVLGEIRAALRQRCVLWSRKSDASCSGRKLSAHRSHCATECPALQRR